MKVIGCYKMKDEYILYLDESDSNQLIMANKLNFEEALTALQDFFVKYLDYCNYYVVIIQNWYYNVTKCRHGRIGVVGCGRACCRAGNYTKE